MERVHVQRVLAFTDEQVPREARLRGATKRPADVQRELARLRPR
jgi:hypothetical protein